MARVIASIKEGDTTILEDIEVDLQEITDTHGIVRRHGSFPIPPGNHIHAGNYELHLADGRSGTILVGNHKPPDGQRPGHAQFSGPIRLS